MPPSRDPNSDDARGASSGANESVRTAGGWSERAPALRRKAFPGPADAREPLRVAMTRETYADLVAHAKGSLHAEICGVLAGEVCEDPAGPFVSVEAVIRGAAAKKASTHVTFTQETWTQIHQEMEQKHPRRQIVGWYHTHPGFGVEFSEMDLFVQRNFFSGPGQIAYVTDPLGGDEAILVNMGGQVVPVARFWVDGRERRCKAAVGAAGASGPGMGAGAADALPASVSQALAAMDQRVSQLMQMVDAHSASSFRLLLTMGMVIALAVCGWIAYFIYSDYVNHNRPPELQSFVPVPVRIGDQTVLLGVGVVKWDVPPSLNAAFLELERQKQAAATQPASQPATQPSK